MAHEKMTMFLPVMCYLLLNLTPILNIKSPDIKELSAIDANGIVYHHDGPLNADNDVNY